MASGEDNSLRTFESRIAQVLGLELLIKKPKFNKLVVTVTNNGYHAH